MKINSFNVFAGTILGAGTLMLIVIAMQAANTTVYRVTVNQLSEAEYGYVVHKMPMTGMPEFVHSEGGYSSSEAAKAAGNDYVKIFLKGKLMPLPEKP